MVHVRLRTLCLQAIEDGRKLPDLLVAQLELVSEKPQRPTHAETAAVFIEAVRGLVPAVAAPTASARPFGTRVLRMCARGRTRGTRRADGAANP